jgi:hypothetical protein
VSGLGCALCAGSGKVTTYNQRELADKEWDDVIAKRKAQADSAQKKRGAA